jgi:FKBP-type peptidyl-prolyl cis-trans isomerase FklB
MKESVVMKLGTCLLVMMAMLTAAPALAEDADDAEPSTVELTTEAERLAYAIGINMSRNIVQIFGERRDEVDFDLIEAAFQDGLRGRIPALDEDEVRATLQAWQQGEMERQQSVQREAAVDNLERSQEFLEANLSEEGVQVTESGLQYRVTDAGEGESPGPTDQVRVHYEGRLINGTVFDSSIQRGQPIDFPVNGVIPGWTEALQMMKPGAKYELFIPPHLAYGEQGAGGTIPPNAALIFEVELLAVNP